MLLRDGGSVKSISFIFTNISFIKLQLPVYIDLLCLTFLHHATHRQCNSAIESEFIMCLLSNFFDVGDVTALSKLYELLILCQPNY